MHSYPATLTRRPLKPKAPASVARSGEGRDDIEARFREGARLCLLIARHASRGRQSFLQTRQAEHPQQAQGFGL